MLTLFGWLILVIPILFRKVPSYFYITNLDIAFGILAFCMELMIFCDLPGLQWLKSSRLFSLKNSILEKVVSENEDKIKKVRFAIFILTLILVLVILGVFKRSEIIFWSYFVFMFCTNEDIAFALASPEERKVHLQQKLASIKNEWKGILVFFVTLIGILATWIYFFK